MAADDIDAPAMEDAARLFPGDSVAADLVAQAWFVREEGDSSLRDEVREWSQRAIDNESDRPYLWRRYAERLMTFGEYDEAREALDEALALEPWHLQSWELMRYLAIIVDDDELLVVAEGKLCALSVALEAC